MTRLSVNINKVATLRNARGQNTPDLINVAKDIERFGANGITVHPRPDERHIKYVDVEDLASVLTTEFNVEGYPNKLFIDLVKKVRPTQVTLVPDPPGVLTSNAGWDTKENLGLLTEVLSDLKNEGIRTSVFVSTDMKFIEGAKYAGADRVELYTEPYANMYNQNSQAAIKPFVEASFFAKELGLGLNAGHDLNLKNLNFFSQKIPDLMEVSIGHALISDALYYGLENTVQMYLARLNE
ncbi:MAG: pyridoxine 5'-phosphate synthase [Cryomorphaceae bacterium]|nr:MAG: pyridoxine 5'-phosphate synthase [Cryomorphaceae bacterium]